MRTAAIEIPVGKVVSTTDRKHGGSGNIETLSESIGTHGLIQPPAVKRIPGTDGYRVIAGRRRMEAVRKLGWETVNVTLYPDDCEDEAIALAENVNREDMHPLDEAATVRSLLDGGKSAEELARYYNRSVSAIYHRIRLADLIDGIRTMFRDGKINITAASLLAGLPEEDQQKFLEKYVARNVDKWTVSSFVQSVRKFKLDAISDDECGYCKKRTHNMEHGLFDEFSSLDDVCFDGDCYATKWKKLIERAISEIRKTNPDTESVIILNRNIPKFLPPKTKTLGIAGTEYILLAENSLSYKSTTKVGTDNTAWYVCIDEADDANDKVVAKRVEYKKHEPFSYASFTPNLVKNYMIASLPEIADNDREAVAKKVDEIYKNGWRLKSRIKCELLEGLLEKRLGEGSSVNLAAEWLACNFSETDEIDNPVEIDEDYGKIANAVFGPIESFAEIPKDPLLQKVFTFIIVAGMEPDNLPDIDDDDDDWERTEKSIFWKFAGICKDDYIDRYRDCLSKAIAEVGGQTCPDKEDGEQEIY